MMRLGKRGQAINKVVALVIALVVLVVVLFIFRNQVMGALKGYTKISEDAGETVEGVKCQTFLGDRSCETGEECPSGTKKVSPAAGKDWTDCNETETCCEQVI